MSNAIEIKNLVVSFPTPAGYSAVVRGINLTINPGDRVAIVGESGSGKTMMGLSMLGIQPTSAQVEGEILIGDVNMVTAPDAVARKLRGNYISMVFQEPCKQMRWDKYLNPRALRPLTLVHVIDSTLVAVIADRDQLRLR